MKKEKLYVVVSRDNGFICVTNDSKKAESEKEKQILNEEFSGGRPSVWIQETKLI